MESRIKPGKDCIGVGAFALIQNQKGEYLLSKSVSSEKRSEEYEKLWAMVGGTIKFGETVAQALLREIKEETGLSVVIERFLGYNDYIKEGKHWIGLNFIANASSNIFINIEPEKQSDLRWFSPEEIPKEISQYTRDSLRKIKEEA